MRIKPTKVEFDEKAYEALQDDIKALEKSLEEKEITIRAVTEKVEYFFSKLKGVADLSRLDLEGDNNYELHIGMDGMQDRIIIASRR